MARICRRCGTGAGTADGRPHAQRRVEQPQIRAVRRAWRGTARRVRGHHPCPESLGAGRRRRGAGAARRLRHRARGRAAGTVRLDHGASGRPGAGGGRAPDRAWRRPVHRPGADRRRRVGGHGGAVAAGPAASDAQHRRHPRRRVGPARLAASRLLRHRLPPHSARRRPPLGAAGPSRPAPLRLPRPVVPSTSPASFRPRWRPDG